MSEDLMLIVIVIVLLLMVIMYVSSRFSVNNSYVIEDDHTNMSHTNYNGVRLPSQPLPDPTQGGVAEFMNARYKVIVDDGVGDNTEPLNDISIAGFGNPDFMGEKHHLMPMTSRTFWNSKKSTPTIATDDKQLEHVAAEMQTPLHRVQMAKKSKHFLPFSGGKSRLNFTSFENSHSEPKFRQ